MLPAVPVEDYSCASGAGIMLQLCFDIVSLVNGVNVSKDRRVPKVLVSNVVKTHFLASTRHLEEEEVTTTVHT